MDWINAYLYLMLVYLAWSAYLDRSGARDSFIAALIWPVIALIVIAHFALQAIGWEFEIGYSPDDGWGARRPDDGWTGFAIRCPWFELRFWKSRSTSSGSNHE